MEPNFRNMALAIIREYKLMDTMFSPYRDEWMEIEEDNEPEIKCLIEILEKSSGLEDKSKGELNA